MESDIAHASPVTREVFDHLLIKANFADSRKFKRGQWFGTYEHIAEGLHWYEGFRKTKYSTKQIRSAIDFLKVKDMIDTRKSFRGLVITINNYNEYQDPKNYSNMGVPTGNAMEGSTEGSTEGTMEGTHLSKRKEPMAVTTEVTMEVTPEGTIRTQPGQTTLEEYSKNTHKKEKIKREDIIFLMKKLENIFFNHSVQLSVYGHLVEKAVMKVGSIDRVSDTIDFYLDKVSTGGVDKKYIYKHPKNFWMTGIDAIHNELFQKEGVLKKKDDVTRYCIECDEPTTFKKSEDLTICPICNEGDLFTKALYDNEKRIRNPQSEVVTEQEDLSDDPHFQKVNNFLKSFGNG